MTSRRIAFAAAAVVAAALTAAAAASTASASRNILKGIYDDGNTLVGDPDFTYPILKQLRTKVVRINLHWGGPLGVAGADPTVRPTDPNDGQYDWSIYDRAVIYANAHGMKVVFSIVGTPAWANGGKATRVAPTDYADLQNFAFAAAQRYSGTFSRPQDGVVLPPVRHWLAWNEPNNPVFLEQTKNRRFVSMQTYAKICNAVVQGVKATLIRDQKVACGVTAPRGNNNPRARRASVTPIAFLRGMKRFGAKGFDAFAHHPYYGKRTETPLSKPRSNSAIQLGNIAVLDKELRKLYGNRMRIWITEYGFQTAPERLYGVTYRQQAAYLRQAWTIAKRHPRIDMFTWFMLKDDTNIPIGWQSGLMTAKWGKKPSFNVFRSLR